MLVKSVTFNDFLDEFKNFNREDQFSYEGKKALFEYLNELSEDLSEPIELDIIAICSEFTEYDNLEQFNKEYGYSIDDVDCIEDISNYTIVIPINEDSFIIQDF